MLLSILRKQMFADRGGKYVCVCVGGIRLAKVIQIGTEMRGPINQFIGKIQRKTTLNKLQERLKIIPDKKETRHIELSKSQEDHM